MSQKAKFFDQESYKKIPTVSLILLSIDLIAQKNGKKCTFESLIEECFLSFPEAFGFSQHPEWPDSRKLDRPLRLLRKRKLILGNPKSFFSLTRTGEKEAEELAKNFRQKKLFK